MKKDITICFRTRSDIRKYLETIASQQRLSLSYVIESIILEHKQQQGGQPETPADPDRRQYPRKQIMLPALVGRTAAHPETFVAGTVLDISLGGIRFAVSAKSAPSILSDGDPSEYSVTFTLPGQSLPITLRCRYQSASEAGDIVQFGATFVDADFQSCQGLQNYFV